MTLLNVIDSNENLTVNSVTNQIFWAMGANGRGFGLEVMRKPKKIVNLKKKTKIIEYDGS